MRLSPGVLCAALLLPTALVAAEVTEVADAMDERHALEVDLDVTYLHLHKDSKITRESLQPNGTIGLVDELSHSQSIDQLGFRLGIGLWHDLELHVIAPLVLADEQSWGFAPGTTAATSTIANNTVDISGCLSAGSCAAVKSIFPVTGKSSRSGFADPTLGIAWGPINEEREVQLHPELYPPGRPVSTWVIAFDYTLPLPGPLNDPSKFGAASDASLTTPHATERLKAHVFTLWTAFSKRFTVANPYVVFRASAPVAIKGSGPGDGAYDNCWHPEQLSDVATANCADPNWKGLTGYLPPYEGSFTLGTELVFFENGKSRQKLALDVHGEVRYTGPGRTYSQLSDALGKLTYTDEFVTGTASVGLYARAASWLRARVTGLLAVDSAHFLTAEPIGRDFNGDGHISLANGNGKVAPEQSPTYDFRIDQPGRRLRAESVMTWGVTGTVALSF